MEVYAAAVQPVQAQAVPAHYVQVTRTTPFGIYKRPRDALGSMSDTCEVGHFLVLRLLEGACFSGRFRVHEVL